MKKAAACLFVFILLAALGIGLTPQSASDLFQKALTKEKAEGNLEEAIALFQQVVDKGGDEALAAQAQLHIGICYEKLGLGKARESYQKVIDRYPRQAEAVKAAKEKLTTLLRAQALEEKGDREFKITKIHTEKSRDGYLSPDGGKWALIDYDEKNRGIWLRNIASGKEVRLLGSPNVIVDCFWSPDSKLIAYINVLNSVSIVSVEGGQPKTIIEVAPEVLEAGDYVWPMGWTSDSQKLIFQDNAKGLFAIPASG